MTANADGGHTTVLLAEAVAALKPEPGGCFIDCTFGRGGHSSAIFERLGETGKLLAMDKDAAAVNSAQARSLSKSDRFQVVHSSFTRLKAEAERLGWDGGVSGILMDLGVSSPQLDEAQRGFSFMRSGPLDMRMNTAEGPTAAQWLADVTEGDLIQVLHEYGEERHARQIAKALITRRAHQPLVMTGDLARLIEETVPTREKGKHPATRTFQAIRIYLNRELSELEEALKQARDVLKPGGRLVVIAFHSLEDRIVKRFMRNEERGCTADEAKAHVQERRNPVLRRVGRAVKPSLDEIRVNSRARSAVMRVAEKLGA